MQISTEEKQISLKFSSRMELMVARFESNKSWTKNLIPNQHLIHWIFKVQELLKTV